MNQIELGKKIQELRKKQGLTQEELAEKTGISARTIQRIENGEVDPRTYTLNKLAEALETSVDELVEESKNTESQESNNRKWLGLFHLSGIFILIIPPILVWVLKKDDVPEFKNHAKDIFNFQLSMLIYLFCGSLLVLLVIGLPIVIFLAMYSTIIIVINTIKAVQGTPYKYPLSIELIKHL